MKSIIIRSGRHKLKLYLKKKKTSRLANHIYLFFSIFFFFLNETPNKKKKKSRGQLCKELKSTSSQCGNKNSYKIRIQMDSDPLDFLGYSTNRFP